MENAARTKRVALPCRCADWRHNATYLLKLCKVARALLLLGQLLAHILHGVHPGNHVLHSTKTQAVVR